MAVDTPAVIAIVGAGPIGLEAALYARYLGYDVRVYERGRVVERLQQATHAGPGTPWGSSTSPLGLAAICAQRPDWRPPTADAILASGELAATYFLPLADSDLLAECVLVGTEVLSIERDASPGDQTIAEDEVPGFRLRVCDAASERVDTADVVIDASGAGAATFCVSERPGRASGTQPSGADPKVGVPRAGANRDPRRLLTPEVDFYVLGAKSAPDASRFLFSEGLAQIRDLFTIIADRATLDLYAAIIAGQ